MFYLGNRDRIGSSTYLLSLKTIPTVLLAIAFWGGVTSSVRSQSIIEASDGVGTRVESDRNLINIEGGTQSGNNLFHSFEKFGLSASETANFLSNPEVINILGRVVGNEASVIDGLLQTNNNANLFLINPAGIIFGDNASLNISGDFTATTATGIGFGDNNFFNVYGDNDFSTLTGTPFQFAFDSANPDLISGAIINQGNLASAGNISLVGGSVVSTGAIQSSQGNITVSTVPNSSLVTIEQEGNLLSLEIEPPRDIEGKILPFNAIDLPKLLTGKVLVNEVSGENITVRANEENILVGSDATFEATSSLGAIDPFDGDLSANENINLAGNEVIITENSTLTANNLNIQPNNSQINSSATEQDLENLQTSNDEVVGIDLDGDGIPDIPIGIIPGEDEFEPSDETIAQVNSDILSTFDTETIENLQQLENTTITYQPLTQDPQSLLERQIARLDETFSQDYRDYYGDFDPSNPIFVNSEEELEVSLAQIQQVLRKIERATGAKPAVIYAAFYPPEISSVQSQSSILPQPNDELELIVVTADGEPTRKRVEGANRTLVQRVASRFADSIVYELPERQYLPASQQLYEWLVEPLSQDLKTQEIDNLVFILESGIRSIPFAALHDGEKYLVENYSVGMMPSFRLTNTTYQDIREVELLAMGSDTFEDPELAPLPAVPVELDLVTQNLWTGKSFLNEEFTVNNLKQTQDSSPFGILHLATHAEFLPGEPANSYIQFGDRKLRINEVRELGLNNPLVELIVLSACKTAVGDPDAEYGFASLAYQAGVKSALGSLWYVSDSGTLALMSKFYRELKDSPIKAEALRRAQVAMIRGDVRLENGKLIGRDFEFDLPEEISPEQLTHPRYWSPFAIIGNPW